MSKRTPHRWHRYRSIPWPVCLCCGLVWLSNDVTRRAVRAGCEKE